MIDFRDPAFVKYIEEYYPSIHADLEDLWIEYRNEVEQKRAAIAQSVEHIIGNDEVPSSSLGGSSSKEDIGASGLGKRWREAADYDPDACIVNPILSRVCERGTGACGVHHKQPSMSVLGE